MRARLLAILILLASGGLAADLYPTSFSSTGEQKGDLFWLGDPRMYATASWHFTGVAPGTWTLVITAEMFDPCPECGCDRDVPIQVFWREDLTSPWSWRFVELRPEEPGICRVYGEMPVRLNGPELWVSVRRAVMCTPFLGFSQESAYLRAPAVVEVPPPPPPPEIPAPPVVTPPPSPPPQLCSIGPLFSCNPGEVPAECLPSELDLNTVPRTALPDTYGPGDAARIDLGHYLGEIGPGDYQDWYRFSVPKGEAMIVYFEPMGDLVVDVHLVHDPCGTDLAVCLMAQGPTVLEAPCQEGVECVTIPNGLTECFRGQTCGFFLRIVWRSGAGTYRVSLLPAEVKP